MWKPTVNINITSSLLEKIWTTLIDNGLGGLLRPWQIGRVGQAETNVQAKGIITIAQAEKHAADIMAGRKELSPDGRLLDAEPLDSEQAVLKALEDPQRAMLIQRSLNLYRTVEYLMAEESDSDAPISPEAVSRDWFTHWREHAESFSEERFQRLWAAVLAGEVRRPGSFSISAMAILASISSDDAEVFQQLCDMSFSNGDRTIILLAVPGWHGTRSHYQIESPTTTMGEQLVGHGIEHFHLLNMRTIGLLASLPEEEYPVLDILVGMGVDYAGRPVAVKPAVTEGRINVISFTQAGHQLRQFIDKSPHKTYTPALQKLFDDASVAMEFR